MAASKEIPDPAQSPSNGTMGAGSFPGRRCPLGACLLVHSVSFHMVSWCHPGDLLSGLSLCSLNRSLNWGSRWTDRQRDRQTGRLRGQQEELMYVG
jgi:hypothetical protein